MSIENPHEGTLLSEEDDHPMQSKGSDSEDEPNVEAMASGECRTQKKARSALVHNFTEKLRRRRLKEKMKCLQELVPNCSRRDKASVLDDAIKYIKNLQYQLQILSMPQGFSMSHVACMMLSPPMHHGDPGLQLPSIPLIFQHTSPGDDYGTGDGIRIRASAAAGPPQELLPMQTPQAWEFPVLGGTSEDVTIPEHDFYESLLPLGSLPFLGPSFPLVEDHQMPVTRDETSPFFSL